MFLRHDSGTSTQPIIVQMYRLLGVVGERREEMRSEDVSKLSFHQTHHVLTLLFHLLTLVCTNQQSHTRHQLTLVTSACNLAPLTTAPGDAGRSVSWQTRHTSPPNKTCQTTEKTLTDSQPTSIYSEKKDETFNINFSATGAPSGLKCVVDNRTSLSRGSGGGAPSGVKWP